MFFSHFNRGCSEQNVFMQVMRRVFKDAGSTLRAALSIMKKDLQFYNDYCSYYYYVLLSSMTEECVTKKGRLIKRKQESKIEQHDCVLLAGFGRNISTHFLTRITEFDFTRPGVTWSMGQMFPRKNANWLTFPARRQQQPALHSHHHFHRRRKLALMSESQHQTVQFIQIYRVHKK